ncbi:MAG: HD domain-containing protein [Clostridiales bacterium]|nr:HD domain-containing protein [Clostridiales bacterium]
MNARELLEVLTVAERLKDTTRHSWTKNGRHESVAEHSWMTALMAFFIKDQFPDADMDRVIKMCLIHDLGEAFTGDIPTFHKTSANEQTEEDKLADWLKTLPADCAEEMKYLYREMAERKTTEAKIFKALDGLEALVQHNLADLSTWIPLEYELNMVYADDKIAFSDYLKELREEIRKDTIGKIEKSEHNKKPD